MICELLPVLVCYEFGVPLIVRTLPGQDCSNSSGRHGSGILTYVLAELSHRHPTESRSPEFTLLTNCSTLICLQCILHTMGIFLHCSAMWPKCPQVRAWPHPGGPCRDWCRPRCFGSNGAHTGGCRNGAVRRLSDPPG